MMEFRILIFTFLFCIFHKCEILEAAKSAKRKPEVSNVCSTPECKNAASVILQNIDPCVAPCDNFYKFACGNFIKNTPIPKDRTFVNRANLIEEKSQYQLKAIFEEKIQPNAPRWSTLAKNFYKACMNPNAVKTGLHTALGNFKKLGGWPVLEGNSWKEKNFDWKQLIYDMSKLGYATNYLFAFVVGADNNSTKYILTIDQTFPAIDRNYLVKGFNDTIIKAYYNYMTDVAVTLGADRVRAEKELKESLEFEIKLAKITVSDEDLFDKDDPGISLTVKELSKKYQSIPWKQYFNSILKSTVICENEVITINSPTYFTELEKLLKKTPKRVLANYLLWRATDEKLDYLTDELINCKTKFTKNFNLPDLDETKTGWQKCVEITSEQLTASTGALYVRKYFNPESKKSVEDLAANIKQQFMNILKKVDWMDEKTRSISLDRLKSMRNFIGYPAELLDDKTVDEFYAKLEITPNNFFQASLNVSIFISDNFFNQFKKPVNLSVWSSNSLVFTTTALYNAYGNSMEIPAGALQDVLYNKDGPQYLNYATVGSTIGYEISSAIDNVGRNFDINGNSKDWWTPETNTKFLKKADCIIQQYGNYTIEEVGKKLNGKETQDKSIEENVSVKISYLAYQDWVKRHGPEPKMPGLNYSQSQLFWISAAMQQCTKYKPASLKDTTNHDKPAEFRVLGSFSNRPEFSRDFNCQLGSKMNPVKKCSVW